MDFKRLILQRQTKNRILNQGGQLQLILYPLIPLHMPILLALQAQRQPYTRHQLHLVNRLGHIIHSTGVQRLR
ncbi:hypothetical protein D3C75_940210 [compost metagenome]